MPLNVQFYNYSIGDVNTYGELVIMGQLILMRKILCLTYADTGWYSVSLTVYDDYDTNSFLRENYIYVYNLTNVERQDNSLGLICHPNPFKNKICFTYCDNSLLVEKEIVIYNMKGKMIKYLSSHNNEIIWDGTNRFGKKCEPGIYCKGLKKIKTSKKIILTYLVHDKN
ncbi:MAG: hypothetical protein R2764_14805 [Bacteroidales bacterium]